MSTAAVLRFAREHEYSLAAPELLGLPASSRRTSYDPAQFRDRLIASLLAGDESTARQVVFESYLARRPLAEIFDQIVAAAFHEIGERWACHQVQVYQERRGCEICNRILLELRHIQAPPGPTPRAIGGTLEGDLYGLPTTMIELVLREAGMNATALGISIPAESLASAVRDLRPALFWLSVSHIEEESRFVRAFATLTEACQAQRTPLVVGGRALTDSLRRHLVYSAHCDTLEQLARLVESFLEPRGNTSHGDPAFSPQDRPTSK